MVGCISEQLVVSVLSTMNIFLLGGDCIKAES